jgi:hypothetical protein
VIIKSLHQAKRFLTILFGFTLLVVGIAMLVLPGPGMLTILLGLGLLAAEYVWARRLLDRLKQQGDRLRNSIFQRDKSAQPPVEAPPSNASAATVDSRPVPVETHLTIESTDETISSAK